MLRDAVTQFMGAFARSRTFVPVELRGAARPREARRARQIRADVRPVALEENNASEVVQNGRIYIELINRE